MVLGEEFLCLPLSRLETVDVVIDGTRLTVADFSTLPKPDTFLVFAPQWDFLDFLAAQGATLPGFDLRMSTEATDLIVEHGRIIGVRARGPEGDLEVRSPLTVAADGRGSVLRDCPGIIAIGDAAHAMSPMFGVGVNYAIQDAVALANAIHDDLARGDAPEEVLEAVQRRRERPARTMQRLQRLGHRGLSRIVTATGERALPRGLVTLLSILSPRFRPRVASFIGLGLLPEHSPIR